MPKACHLTASRQATTGPQPLTHRWRDGLVLAGISPLPTRSKPGDTFQVELYWRADAPPSRDWTVSVQMLNAEGRLVAQDDHPPLYGFHPTSRWVPGATRLVDTHTLTLPPDTPTGEYTVVVLWYDSTTFERLPTSTGEDRVVLGTVSVEQ